MEEVLDREGRRWRETHREGDQEAERERRVYAGKGHFWIDAYTALLYIFTGGSCWRSLYNIALSTIWPCCGSNLFTAFVFSFVIFMKLDSVICSLGLEWGQWNDRTQLSPLSCAHNSLGHVLAPCTITHTSHLHEFTVPSCREHNATFSYCFETQTLSKHVGTNANKLAKSCLCVCLCVVCSSPEQFALICSNFIINLYGNQLSQPTPQFTISLTN